MRKVGQKTSVYLPDEKYSSMKSLLSQKPFLYSFWAVLVVALLLIFWPRESKQTKLMRKAQKQMAAGQFEQALENVNQVLDMAPNERVQDFRDELVVLVDSVRFVDSLRMVDSLAIARHRQDSLAFAQATPETKAAYEAAFEEGDLTYQQKNWEQAIEAYEKANKLLASPIAKDKILECERRQAGIPLPDFRTVPEGSFQMNMVVVSLSDFSMAQTEVTNEQYCAFLNEMGNQTEGGLTWLELSKYAQIEMLDGKFQPKRGKAQHPVVEVSWYGAAAYCKWLGTTYRLPTEKEWEYAAGWAKNGRLEYGGTDGNNIRYYANYKGKGQTDTYKASAPVQSFKPNGLGLYDMSGNVWEWCYPSFVGGEEEERSPTLRAYRGGSWNSSIFYLRTDRSFNKEATDRSSYLGFRPVQVE